MKYRLITTLLLMAVLVALYLAGVRDDTRQPPAGARADAAPAPASAARDADLLRRLKIY